MDSRSDEMSDRPLPMGSWEAEAVLELGHMYERKVSEEQEEVNTVWQSMYEKGLGRKVSQWNYPPKTPPVSPAESESSMSAGHEVEKKGLAAVHRERAMKCGLLRKDDGREWRKRAYSSPPSIESVQRDKAHKEKEADKTTQDKADK